MPPIVALCLCAAFVLGLLRIDHRRNRGLSKITWLPTLWFLIAASRPVAQWFTGGEVGEEGASVEDGSPLDRFVLLCLITLGMAVLAKRRFDWSTMLRDNRWLVLLFVYMLVSILWSDFPFVSFKRWIKTAGSVVMALVVLTELSPLSVLHSILMRTAYILVPFSLMLIKYYPPIGVAFGRWSGGTMWVGATMTKNTLGALCMVSIFVLVWTLVRRRERKLPRATRYDNWADLIVLGLACYLIRGPGGAYSATSIAVLVLGLAVFFLVRRLTTDSRQLRSRIIAAVLGTAGLFVLVDAVAGESPVALVARLLGRDPTLTGRTDLIWSELIPLSLKNPVLGVGYGAFWIRPIFEFPINQAHNGYLDVFIELGAVGLVLLSCLIVSFCGKAIREFRWDPDWAALRLAFLLIVIMHNNTETSFLRSTILLWNLLVLLMIVHPVRRSSRSATPAASPDPGYRSSKSSPLGVHTSRPGN